MITRKRILRIKSRCRSLQQNESLIILLEDDSVEEFSSLFLNRSERDWEIRLFLLKEGDYLLYEDGTLVAIQYQTGDHWSRSELQNSSLKNK